MGFLAARTKNLVRRTRGMVGTMPRIVNMSRTPNAYIVGYIEVNKNATTPFSRGKVHQGRFCCPREDVSGGDLIFDRGDEDYYFVMDSKVEIFRGEDVYIDATMYRCDSEITISRFGQDTTKDTFGRAVVAAPTVIASGVRAMFNPMNFDVKEQQDRIIGDNKIKMCVQSSVDVKPADRITTKAGSVYHVITVDTESTKGLTFYTVDTDVR